MNFYQLPSRAEWHANQNAPQQNNSMDIYDDVLCKSDQQSNTEAEQECGYVNVMVAKKVEEEAKQNKNGNKTLIIAVTALMIAFIMMGVFIALFIKLSNEQTSTITAMNRTIFELDKKNIQLLQDQQNQLQLHINDFQNETFDLRSNDEDLNNKTRDLVQGYEELENGWITPFNGFQYKYNNTTNYYNWYDARTFCNGIGGDLASLGIWDMEIRRILKEALNINSNAWIGLNDINSEGSWYWVRSYGSNYGYRAAEATALWYSGQPSSSDCAFLDSSHLLAYSHTCSHNHYSVLCGKRL